MLGEILNSAGLNAKVCADLLGLDNTVFHEWLVGQRPVPAYIVPELCSVLGVPKEAILSSRRGQGGFEDAPAIWFRFRSGEKLTDADREIVVVIRRLAHFMDELDRLTDTRYVTWKAVFGTIKGEIDKQSSPKDQGKLAARIVRADRQFGFPIETLHGVKGTGDVLRDNLRSMAIRIIETPVPLSNLEGCSFFVGAPGAERPCLFANTYRQTWFRRNFVLIHELAHAIFDIEGTAASLDFLKENGSAPQLEELRADAFATEALVPRELLNHVAKTCGLKWEALSNKDIATLVARTQVEQRLVFRAAHEAGYVTRELADEYSQADIHDELVRLTDHALTTQEFVDARQSSHGAGVISAEDRTTTVPSRALRLPLPYVHKIVQLASQSEISYGKAAQMLMIDKDTFLQRFQSLIPEAIA